MRGLPALILVLGFVSLVFGVIFVMGSNEMKSSSVEGFSRSEGVNTAADIKEMKEVYTTQKEAMEDAMAAELGYTGPFNADNKLPGDVKQQLYLSNPGYAAMIDAQAAYGMGTLLLGVADLMLYSGIAMLAIGTALIVASLILLTAGNGLVKIGARMSTIKTRLAQAQSVVPVSEAPEIA